MNHLVQGIKKEKAYTGHLRGLNYYGGLVDVNTFGGPAVCFVLKSLNYSLKVGLRLA